MLGTKSVNGVVAMIFNKSLRLSSATNKVFSQGEIVNFMQVDAPKIQMIAQNIANFGKFPIQITISLILLFYYLGWAFFAGIGVIIFSTILNFFLAKYIAQTM